MILVPFVLGMVVALFSGVYFVPVQDLKSLGAGPPTLAAPSTVTAGPMTVTVEATSTAFETLTQTWTEVVQATTTSEAFSGGATFSSVVDVKFSVAFVVLIAALGCCVGYFAGRRKSVSRNGFENFSRQVGQMMSDNREQSSVQSANLLEGINQALQGQQREFASFLDRPQELVTRSQFPSSVSQGTIESQLVRAGGAAGRDDDTTVESLAILGVIGEVRDFAAGHHQQSSEILRHISRSVGEFNIPRLGVDMRNNIRDELHTLLWMPLHRLEGRVEAVANEVRRAAEADRPTPATTNDALDRSNADESETRRQLIEFQDEQRRVNGQLHSQQSDICTMLARLGSQIEAALSEGRVAVPVSQPLVSSAPGSSGQVREESGSPDSKEHIETESAQGTKREEDEEGEDDGKGIVDKDNVDNTEDDKKDGPKDRTPAPRRQAAAEPQSNASSQPDVLPIPAGVGALNIGSSRNTESEDSGNGSTNAGKAALGPDVESMTGVVSTGEQSLAPPVPTETAMDVDSSADLGATTGDHVEDMDDVQATHEVQPAVDNGGDVEMSSGAPPAAGNESTSDQMDVDAGSESATIGAQNPGSRDDGAEPMDVERSSFPNVLLQFQPAARPQIPLPAPSAPEQQRANTPAGPPARQPRPKRMSLRAPRRFARPPTTQLSAPASAPSAPPTSLPPLIPFPSLTSSFPLDLSALSARSSAPAAPAPASSAPFSFSFAPSPARPDPAQGTAPVQQTPAVGPAAGSGVQSEGGSDISDPNSDDLAEATKVAKATVADAGAEDDDAAALRDLEEAFDEQQEASRSAAPSPELGPSSSSALPYDPRPRDTGTVIIDGGEIDLYPEVDKDLTPRDPASIGAAVAGPSSSGSRAASAPPAATAASDNADLHDDVLLPATILSSQTQPASASVERDEALAHQLADAEAHRVKGVDSIKAQYEAMKASGANVEPEADAEGETEPKPMAEGEAEEGEESDVSEETGPPGEPMPKVFGKGKAPWFGRPG
ncbi:MAG: hypothetical protein Q9160_008107 [Pyrenula sp. 1 TL-2023]